MKWVNDRTGRFGKRPHFELDELDVACERIMSDFLRRHRGQVRYPISLDDLTVLVEAMTTSLDLYADLTADGADVEGVTDFRLGKRPEVSVAAVLAEDERRVNRLKTTLTHELGHVHFHDTLFQDRMSSADLFAPSEAARVVCFRDRMIDAAESDWLEWQACYASGAFLMPRTALQATLDAFRRTRGVGVIGVGSEAANELIGVTTRAFGTSRDAARVRLSKLGMIVRPEASLFD